MHISHRTLGTSLYLMLVAGDQYVERKIAFRTSTRQEYHVLHGACVFLETLESNMIPGGVTGAFAI